MKGVLLIKLIFFMKIFEMLKIRHPVQN